MFAGRRAAVDEIEMGRWRGQEQDSVDRLVGEAQLQLVGYQEVRIGLLKGSRRSRLGA
jgi:hypothetical protein